MQRLGKRSFKPSLLGFQPAKKNKLNQLKHCDSLNCQYWYSPAFLYCICLRNIKLLLPANVHQYAQHDWHLAKQPWPRELTLQPANKNQPINKTSISTKFSSTVFSFIFHSFTWTNLVFGPWCCWVLSLGLSHKGAQ